MASRQLQKVCLNDVVHTYNIHTHTQYSSPKQTHFVTLQLHHRSVLVTTIWSLVKRWRKRGTRGSSRWTIPVTAIITIVVVATLEWILVATTFSFVAELAASLGTCSSSRKHVVGESGGGGNVAMPVNLSALTALKTRRTRSCSTFKN